MKARTWFLIFTVMLALGLGLGIGLELARALLDTEAPEAVPEAWAQFADPVQPVPTGRSARHTRVVDIAQEVSPAVVSIGVTKMTYGRQYDPFGSDFFFTPYLVRPLKRQFPYLGSGFIIDDAGHVITNYHVIEDASSISVTLTDRRTYPARLLDADRYVDIALLELQGVDEGEDLPVLPMGDSDDIMIGETVLAVGNPFGPLIADPRPSVSVGVVSAVRRSFRNYEEDRVYHDMIQSDAAINPGNSGGPLVNLEGKAIGVNTFIFSRSGDSASVGFSIPANRVARIVEEILRFGKVRAIWLDFDVLSLSPYIIQALGIEVTEGALVRTIDPGGPAQRAGLAPGDVIVAVDGKEVKDARDLLANFLTRTVGETVEIAIVRNGDEQAVLEYTIDEGGAR